MDKQLLEHYRIYMKAYGGYIMELADKDEEIIKIITGENAGGLFRALRKQIEHSPNIEITRS